MKNYHYFNINYQCDSNCIFCAANHEKASSQVSKVLTPKKFEDDLLSANVKAEDKIRISGGEPTLSPFFWEILKICRKYDCIIDLTTNGHFFSNIKNVETVLKFCPIIIRIPLFGLSEKHDYLTGKKGNFNETITALENFSKYSGDFTINVKFLLCKATISSNQEVFNLLYSRYGNLFEYTISPLIISRKVRENASELIDTNTNMIINAKEFIENDNINCDLLPLCLLSEKKRNKYLSKFRNKYMLTYNNPDVSLIRDESSGEKKCEFCDIKEYCYGFLPSYLKYFGTDECHPIKIFD